MKIVNFILLVLWMIIIFGLSNQSGTVSTNQSSVLVDFLYSIIHIDKDVLIVVVRKFAHIVEYLILFILMYNYIKYHNIKNKLELSMILCILYSIIDETHQLFISGRSGQILDVFIDSIGILIGYIGGYYGKKKIKENSSS